MKAALARLIAAALTVGAVAGQDCTCGYRDESGNLWQKAVQLPFGQFKSITEFGDLIATERFFEANEKNPNTRPRQYTKDNVYLENGALVLRNKGMAPGSKDVIQGAEMGSQGNVILYGTFRATLQTPKVAGVCSAMFFYADDDNEVDLEILSKQSDRGIVHNVIHKQLYLPDDSKDPRTYTQVDLSPVNTANGFQDMRFDWLPDRVDYYANGNKYNTLSTNIPTKPGRIMFVVFSNGDPSWSAGPPVTDAVMRIQKASWFYNTTGGTQDGRCSTPATRDALTCTVAQITSENKPILVTPYKASSSAENYSSGVGFLIGGVVASLGMALTYFI